jgi:hypothetical protein
MAAEWNTMLHLLETYTLLTAGLRRKADYGSSTSEKWHDLTYARGMLQVDGFFLAKATSNVKCRG